MTTKGEELFEKYSNSDEFFSTIRCSIFESYHSIFGTRYSKFFRIPSLGMAESHDEANGRLAEEADVITCRAEGWQAKPARLLGLLG